MAATLKYRKLDSDGDYVFGHNANDFYIDNKAATQAIKTHLKLFSGEWWEDTSEGLPLVDQILGVFGPNGNKAATDLIIKERILSTASGNTSLVVDVSDFSSTFDPTTRAYTFTGTVDTIFGSAELTNLNLLSLT